MKGRALGLHSDLLGNDDSSSGLLDKSHLVHGLFCNFCFSSAIPFRYLQSSKKLIILFQPVWYCGGEMKDGSPHPSPEVSSTKSNIGKDMRPKF